MTLIPLRNDVVIIPIADPDVSEGGKIITPEEAKQRVDQGIVKYRGPDCIDVRVGDYVLFSGWSGRKITVDDEGVLYVMEETFIECIVNDEDPADHLITIEDAKRIFRKVMDDRVLREQTTREEADGIIEDCLWRLDALLQAEGFEF